MEPAYDGNMPEDIEDAIPLEMFADSSENAWWIELVKTMGGGKDVSYSKKTDMVSFNFRIKRDGKYVGNTLQMYAKSMMELMLKCGSLTFDTDLIDAGGHEWEIDVPVTAQSLFSMFLESLEEHSSEMNNALRGVMAYQSGMLNGVVMSNEIDYDSFIDALFTLITALNENEDEEDDDDFV